MRFHVRTITATVILLFIAASAHADAGFLEHLEQARLPRITPPRVRVFVLENGIRCYVLEDHTLPLVKMGAIVKVGGIYEPGDKVGLAQLSGMLMRSGGAGELGPADFDAALDEISAALTSGIGREMGVATLEVLSDELERGAKLFFDMLFAPGFDAARFKVARLKLKEALIREEDDPSAIAGIKFRQLVYGPQNPWARRPDGRSLARIGVKDLRQFHRRYFRTNNIIIAAAGDFSSNKLRQLIGRLTAKAPSGEVRFPEVPEVKLTFQPGLENIRRRLTQSFIRMGHLAIRRHNPDKYSLYLMDEILGSGGFTSRLVEDIRIRRGLAYSIWSDLSAGTDYGLFVVGVDTKPAQAAKVMGLIRGQIARMAADGQVSDEELGFARQSVLARLIFEFDSAFKVADRRAMFYFYGYPDNYWSVFRDRIAGVTKEDIRRVAKRYLHPDGMKVVVVGP
jgi:zinc protease